LSSHSKDQKHEDSRIKGLPDGADSREDRAAAVAHEGSLGYVPHPGGDKTAVQGAFERDLDISADMGKTCYRIGPEDNGFFVHEEWRAAEAGLERRDARSGCFLVNVRVADLFDRDAPVGVDVNKFRDCSGSLTNSQGLPDCGDHSSST